MILMLWVANLTAPTLMNNPSDMALLDTNVLVYADQRKSKYHQASNGLAIHDLHLAATILSNGVKKIYTFNTKHFSSLSEIEVILPPEPNIQSKKSRPTPRSFATGSER